MERAADFLLVIPAHREHLRLPPFLGELTRALSKAPFTTEVRVVDDGSPEGEWQALRKAMEALRREAGGSCRLAEPLRHPQRRGKGAAILTGWRLSPAAYWVAFIDADGAIPASEAVRLLGLALAGDVGTPALFAVRAGTVRRRAGRRAAALLFAAAVRLLFGRLSPAGDTQCGFKIVPATFWTRLDPLLRERGFCFDVELYLACRRLALPMKEVSIAWAEQSGRFSPFHAAPWVLADLLKLRGRWRRGSITRRPVLIS